MSVKKEIVAGVQYTLPKVTLLKESGLGVAEIAARTCYDSFENSENECIKHAMEEMDLDAINGIENSALLSNLAWVHHHHSIIEHATLSFLIQGTSRGVLHEHVRHRLQNISVRSSRYTMGSLINAFIASVYVVTDKEKNRLKNISREFFIKKVLELDMFVTSDDKYNSLEIGGIWDKLSMQRENVGSVDFVQLSVAKSSIPFLSTAESREALFSQLQAGKKKRNVGDSFKHVVSDNWKVDLVVTFNIRSLKNYFDLRDSGAAWFQIQWLAKAMKEATPLKYLKLIDKQSREL